MPRNLHFEDVAGARTSFCATLALLLSLFSFTTHAWSQQATISPSSLSFRPQLIGGFGSAPKTQSVTLTNTGSANLTMNAIFVGDNFNTTTVRDYVQTNNCAKSLAPGASCVVKVTFVPVTLGTFNSSLTFEDNDPSQIQVVNLSGSSFDPFGLSASSLKFGSIVVGKSSPAQSVTLTNRQDQPISVLSIATSGDYGQTNNCPSSLAAGQSCGVSVVFQPTASAAINGALSFAASAGSNQSEQLFSIPLSGTGTGGVVSHISVQPASINFGNLGDNSSSGAIVKAVTVTNTSSSASLTFQGVSLSPFSYFIIQANNCTGMLAPGASCKVQLTNGSTSDGSSPLLPQAHPDALTILDSDPTSPQVVGLSMNAVQEATFNVPSLSFAPQAIGTPETSRCWISSAVFSTLLRSSKSLEPFEHFSLRFKSWHCGVERCSLVLQA